MFYFFSCLVQVDDQVNVFVHAEGQYLKNVLATQADYVSKLLRRELQFYSKLSASAKVRENINKKFTLACQGTFNLF